jgi:hypothetical protein
MDASLFCHAPPGTQKGPRSEETRALFFEVFQLKATAGDLVATIAPI